MLPGTHCSSCGDEIDPFDGDDGYTECCNKRVCFGDGADRWSIAATYDSKPNLRKLRACCLAGANVQADAIGVVVLERVL